MEIGVFWALAATLTAVSALFFAAWRPRWVIEYALWILAFMGLLSVLALGSFFEPGTTEIRLWVDPSTAPLLPRDDPAGPIYRQAVADFGDDEVYAVALRCEAVFEQGCLSELQTLSVRLARLEGIRHVSSLMDVTHFEWEPENEWVEIRPFIEEVPSDPAQLASLREEALSDPVYRQTLVGTEGRVAATNLSFKKMDDATFLSSGLDDRVVEILTDEIPETDRFHLAGRPHVKVHVYRGILRDLMILVPLGVIVMAFVLSFFFRSLRGVLLPLGTAFVGNLWTFGLIAALNQPLTLLTGLLSPLLMAIGSVYGVHVMARYEEEALGSAGPSEAALACLQHIRMPAVIATLTTLVGFGALLITDVPAVFDFGLFAMLGIACCSLVALAGIPAWLSRLPLRVRRDGPVQSQGRALDQNLGAWAGWVSGRSGGIILVWAILASASALLVPRIEIDTDYLSHFAVDDPVRLDFEAVNQSLAGVVPLYVVVEASGPGGLRDPELLEALGELQDELGRVPGVSRTLSFLDPLRKLNKAFHGNDPAYDRIPEMRPAIAELLFMMPKQEISRYLTLNHTRANIIVRTGAVGSASVLQLERDLKAVLQQNPLPQGAQAQITGNAILLSRSADGITRGQPLSVGFAALAIFVLISLGLKSPKLGAVAMVPNLIPVILFFGALGLGVAPLSLPVSLIGSMALGIAIDDTVHYLVRYRRERESGAAPDEAVLRCTRRVGRPIVITSVMLFLGFLLITVSPFATIGQFGALAAFTMAVCLATDLVLLPALLVKAKV